MEELRPSKEEEEEEGLLTVTRIRVYFFSQNTHLKGEPSTGWASLTGRTREDHDPILEIIKKDYSSDPSIAPKQRGEEGGEQGVKGREEGELPEEELPAGMIESCPFCPMQFSASSLFTALQIKQHIDQCLLEGF